MSNINIIFLLNTLMGSANCKCKEKDERVETLIIENQKDVSGNA
jgi:hypothetical protein